MMEKPSRINKKLWKDLASLLMNHKKTILKLLIPLILVSIMDVLFPLFNAYALDTLSLGQSSNLTFIIFILIYFVMIIILAVGVYYYLHYTGIVEGEFAYDLRSLGFAKVQELSYAYFDRMSDGWIISRLTSDITRVTEILSWGLIDALYGLASMILIAIIMLFVNVKLALLVLSMTPVLILVSLFFQKRILMKQREVRKHNSEVTAALAENINGAKTIKSLSIEDKVCDEFYDLSLMMKRSAKSANLLSSLFIPIIIFLGGVTSSLVIWYGGSAVLHDVIPFGLLMMFVSYVNLYFQPLREIARIIAEMQMAQASAERILELINEPVEVSDSNQVVEIYGTILEPKVEMYPPMKGHVEFRNIEFYYQKEEPILKDFNLVVKEKSSVALVGETGSGKSTIINLLSRFYEPISGEILIDGVDYRERSLGWLRKNIGTVLQTPHLFSGSILENVRYGNLEASDEEVIEACKKVFAHDFIVKFKEGYQTEVGENGSRLSTGQKQLISFARALLKNPSIFILDEATASIDTETEALIQDAIKTVLKDKTSFIVAHRLSTIVNSDLILVLKKGKIVESGTHLELLQQKGYYYSLYTHQFKENEEGNILSY